MSRYLSAGPLTLLLLGLITSAADAQDQWLAGLYGSGVHAFFAGNYEDAHKQLTSAIDEGTRDPRCYFFRGLTYLRLGRPDEAAADFKRGAELETGNTERFYAVSDALERVQGNERLQLEQYRESERLAARSRQLAQWRARYERLQRAEEHVLRQPDRPPLTDIPPLPKNVSPDPTDPFRSQEGSPLASGQPEVIAPSIAVGPSSAAQPSGAAKKSTLGALLRAVGKSLPGAPSGQGAAPGEGGADPFSPTAPPAAAPGPGPPAPSAGAPEDPFAPSAPVPPAPSAGAPAPALEGAAPAADPFGGPTAPPNEKAPPAPAAAPGPGPPAPSAGAPEDPFAPSAPVPPASSAGAPAPAPEGAGPKPPALDPSDDPFK